MEHGATWQEAAVREAWEETGVRVDPLKVKDFATLSAPDGYLLVFGLGPMSDPDTWDEFCPSTEALARGFVDAPVPLAFSLHTEAVARYYGK